MAKTIYNLELFECFRISDSCGAHLRRVPGGWLYETPANENGNNPICFIPFDNEFMPKHQEIISQKRPGVV